MAPVQTQTITSAHHFSNPITVLSTRITKPPTTRSRRTTTTSSSSTSSTSSPKSKSKPLLSYSPQIPPPHPSIPIPLLLNKLLLTCRPFIPRSSSHATLQDGLYARATHWITPASLAASKNGKHKRYFVLHTDEFVLQPFGSAWEARVVSGGARGIDAGNGVVVFVRERAGWRGFVRGWKAGEKRVGGELGGKKKKMEGEGLGGEGWRRKCGLDGEDGRGQGPMWVCVRAGLERIKRGEG